MSGGESRRERHQEDAEGSRHATSARWLHGRVRQLTLAGATLAGGDGTFAAKVDYPRVRGPRQSQRQI